MKCLLNNPREEMRLKSVTLEKGTILYRRINCGLDEFIDGMTQNAGKPGRCNCRQNIYYCCQSVENIKIEYPNLSGGIIVETKIIEPITLGMITDEKWHTIFRSREPSEQKTPFHSECLAQIGHDIETDYCITNYIANAVFRYFPDGVKYSSVNSFDVVIGNNIFCVSDENAPFINIDSKDIFTNIALTESGYNKTEFVRKYQFDKNN